MANEHSYIRLVHKYFDKETYRWKICDDYEGGVPDCFYEGDLSDLWVEYKYIKPFPKRHTTMIDLSNPKYYLSKLQQLWLTRRENRRHDTAVIAGSEHGGVIFWGDSWKTPITAEDFRYNCLPAREIMQCIVDRIH